MELSGRSSPTQTRVWSPDHLSTSRSPPRIRIYECVFRHVSGRVGGWGGRGWGGVSCCKANLLEPLRSCREPLRLCLDPRRSCRDPRKELCERLNGGKTREMLVFVLIRISSHLCLIFSTFLALSACTSSTVRACQQCVNICHCISVESPDFTLG